MFTNAGNIMGKNSFMKIYKRCAEPASHIPANTTQTMSFYTMTRNCCGKKLNTPYNNDNKRYSLDFIIIFITILNELSVPCFVPSFLTIILTVPVTAGAVWSG